MSRGEYSDERMHDDTYNPYQLNQTICEWVYPDPGCTKNCTPRYVCYNTNTYDPATDYRGNVASIIRYPDTSDLNNKITDTLNYDVLGNVVKMTLDCCQEKSLDYSIDYNFAYVTSQTRGTGTLATGDKLTSTATYDLNTGLVRTSGDENNQTTTLDYYQDNLRLYKTTRPDTGYTTLTYEDGLVTDPDVAHKHSYIRSNTYRGSGQSDLISWNYMDGRGATARAFTQTDDATDTYVTTDAEYDAMGRLSRTSNPYYTPQGPLSAIPTANLWTTNTYDGLGRPYQITFPNATMFQTIYNGKEITTTDQAAKTRRSVRDALGRIMHMDEPDATGALGTVAAPTQPTNYLYDAMDRLVKITQGTQQRFFKFDGLGRLTYERQPEQNAPHQMSDALTGNNQWSHKMVYNGQSLLTDDYDARDVHATMTYDALNRIKQVIYNVGTSSAVATPNVDYTYGTSATSFNLGRIKEIKTASNSTIPETKQAFTYDLMGRVTGNTQTVGTSIYTVGYEYDLTDLMTKETYPDATAVNYEYDRALRLKSVADNNASRIYANNYKYSAHGGMKSEDWGNGATYAMDYNSRLQTTQIKLSRMNAEVQRYDYAFGVTTLSDGTVDATQNNGQIGRIQSYTTGVKKSEERYAYDSLGRLDLAAVHKSDGSLDYRSDFDYDRFGNRYQPATGSQNYKIGYTPVNTGDIDLATNRYTAATNIAYDSAGNITTDYKFRQLKYSYDANNRVRQTNDSDNNGIGTSVYDAAGQRVMTTIGNEWRHFVYDVAGKVVAEYGPDGWERNRIYRAGGSMIATVEAIGNCRKTIEQFVQEFYWGALGRQPSTSEASTWVTDLRAAQGQGQSQLLQKAKDLGNALFTSTEYTNRNRTDREYIADLYWAHLQRSPENEGYEFWVQNMSDCAITPGCDPRPHLLEAFNVSDEFAAILQQLCTSQPNVEVLWQMSDHTSSVRLMMDATGSVVARHDYLPFGDEHDGDFARPGGTNSMNGKGNGQQAQAVGETTTGLDNWRNAIRPRYGDMDKDGVSGLDHTQFRKYDAWSGRWNSPDPYMGSMSVADPQSFNRYAYTQNDPVNNIDPSGGVV